MANRYVNTASTAGGDGTTNATSGANRAWADLAEAANGLGASLSTPIDLYCEGSTADTSNVNQTVWDMTTTATNKLRIIGEQSPLHPNFSTAKSGKYDTSLYHITCTNRNGLYNNIPDHVEYHGIQVHVTVSNAGSYIAFKTSNANQTATDILCLMSHCIAKATQTSGSIIGFETRFPGTGGRGTSKVINCLSIDCQTGYSNDFGLSGDVGEIYNCTAAGGTYGFVENATMKVVNCLATGVSSIGFVGTFAAGSNYNAEDDGNGAPGANSRSSQTFTFVNAASDDFHLASTDTGAKDFGVADPDSGGFSDDIDGQTRSGSWDIGFDEYQDPPVEQEGFRWGVDDGNESSHTWEANQDTSITITDTQNRLLRLLINASSSDPASTAYTLRTQKNGSGGYSAVNVGSTTDVNPTPDNTDDTLSGSNTASTSWAVSVPNASTGDLLIFCIAWDDSTATTDVTEPTGQNGETLSEVNATPATDSGTETRCKVWYCKCTGAWTSGTITFTPAASEQWAASVIRIPSGEFDATTPIGASVTNNSTVDGSNIQCGSFSAGGSDGGGRLCVWASADTDPQTVASGFTEISNQDIGAVSGGFFTRNTIVTDSESISATTCSTIATDSWCTVAFIIRPYVLTNECYIATSANITAGGEATTARLTAPSGKTTSDFVTGRRWDDENGTDTIDITSNDYTEVEWNVYIAASASPSDYYDFRAYGGSNPLTTYTVTPRWTIDGGGSTSRQSFMLIGCGR